MLPVRANRRASDYSYADVDSHLAVNRPSTSADYAMRTPSLDRTTYGHRITVMQMWMTDRVTLCLHPTSRQHYSNAPCVDARIPTKAH